MKKAINLILLVLLALTAGAGLDIKAESAILIDAGSGSVLYEKNADVIRAPASTTKMMTAILLIENANLQDEVTVGPNVLKATGSSLHLKPGEKIKIFDLLCAILMRSANDACVAAAEHVSGSVEKFSTLMNLKAIDLKMMHTHFNNPHGLNDPLHSTTARDLAILASYCMKNQTFRDVITFEKCLISRSLNREDLLVRNHNKLLGKYPGLEGIKTGYTVPAGHCFVGCASRNGFRIISVVMKSPNWQAETKMLLDYGFKSFRAWPYTKPGAKVGDVSVDNGESSSVSVVVGAAGMAVIPVSVNTANLKGQPKYDKLTAPILEGQQVGVIEVKEAGRPVGIIPLVAEKAVPIGNGSSSRRAAWTAIFAALIAAAVIRRRRNG